MQAIDLNLVSRHHGKSFALISYGFVKDSFSNPTSTQPGQ